MHALSQCLLATSISAVLALSTPARSLDRSRTSNGGLLRFRTSEPLSNIQPISFFRLGDLEKASVSGLRVLMAGLTCPSTHSRMKPAKLPQPTCGTISAWIVPRCNTLGLLGHFLPSRRSARE